MIAERKYTGLEAISRVFRILAWVAAIVGGLAVIGASFGLVGQERSGEALATLILGSLVVALYVLIFLAASEGIKIMIDIEDNTRRTANALVGGRASEPPSYPPPPSS
jgi:uncharacterized membrane protein